ncbi:MAG: DUF4397 domain-containing protein [Gammaproteobacteria bacterium]|nr:DUF4397 domain-containing protein [Gammaproteobacteria bacterium]
MPVAQTALQVLHASPDAPSVDVVVNDDFAVDFLATIEPLVLADDPRSIATKGAYRARVADSARRRHLRDSADGRHQHR